MCSSDLLYCHDLAWSPDGRTLAALQPAIEFWAVQPTGAMSSQSVALPGGGTPSYWKLAWSRSGDFLAVAAHSGKIAVWRRESAVRMSAVRELPCPGRVNSLQFSPDAASLAAACSDGSVYLFKEPTRPAAGGAAVAKPEIGPPRPPRPRRVAPDDDPFGAPEG